MVFRAYKSQLGYDIGRASSEVKWATLWAFVQLLPDSFYVSFTYIIELIVGGVESIVEAQLEVVHWLAYYFISLLILISLNPSLKVLAN